MTAILIIGMHRSGTSLVTGLLKNAGVYLGPEESIVPQDQSNAAGYWEHIGFQTLNDRLLKVLGGVWYDPPRLDQRAMDTAAVDALRPEAQALIDEQFAVHALWAVKDPRATLVLPFWQSIIPNPRYVLCVRNPLDVAASLYKRDHMPVGLSTALWHIYTASALRDTAKDSRLILHYEQLLKNPTKASEQLMAILDAEVSPSGKAPAQMGDLVDKDLRHHEHTLQDLQDHPQVPGATKRLYEALLHPERSEPTPTLEFSPDKQELLYGITQACGALITDLLQANRSENERQARLIQELSYKLDVAQAARQNQQDILNSRAHRLASRVNRLVLALRSRPSRQ